MNVIKLNSRGMWQVLVEARGGGEAPMKWRARGGVIDFDIQFNWGKEQEGGVTLWQLLEKYYVAWPLLVYDSTI